MLMGIKDLGDVPALILRPLQALPVIQRVDSHCLTRLWTDNQVIEISVRVAGPYLLNDHNCSGAEWIIRIPQKLRADKRHSGQVRGEYR